MNKPTLLAVVFAATVTAAVSNAQIVGVPTELLPGPFCDKFVVDGYNLAMPTSDLASISQWVLIVDRASRGRAVIVVAKSGDGLPCKDPGGVTWYAVETVR